MVGIFLTSCADNRTLSTEELLQDPAKQEEIMIAISNDDQLMANMMDHMMKNGHSMQMMMENRAMMGKMTRGGSAMGMRGGNHGMMQPDSTLCRMMMDMLEGKGTDDPK